mmetsp:Transcript_9367/g.22099  ORF Transcript_9367/g.22099 Transcript_9367/m.22099 type:complete len:326 (+) Transcript_9367:781-1758(+)
MGQRGRHGQIQSELEELGIPEEPGDRRRRGGDPVRWQIGAGEATGRVRRRGAAVGRRGRGEPEQKNALPRPGRRHRTAPGRAQGPPPHDVPGVAVRSGPRGGLRLGRRLPLPVERRDLWQRDARGGRVRFAPRRRRRLLRPPRRGRGQRPRRDCDWRRWRRCRRLLPRDAQPRRRRGRAAANGGCVAARRPPLRIGGRVAADAGQLRRGGGGVRLRPRRLSPPEGRGARQPRLLPGRAVAPPVRPRAGGALLRHRLPDHVASARCVPVDAGGDGHARPPPRAAGRGGGPHSHRRFEEARPRGLWEGRGRVVFVLVVPPLSPCHCH